MVNDILEQIAEDYFRELGYFTQHNVKYKPKEKGPAFSVHSDIDIIGVHPKKSGVEKVVVVSCKSWQGGMSIEKELDMLKNNPEKITNGKSSEKRWKEFFNKYWTEGLRQKVFEMSGQKNFTFCLAVTKYTGKKELWENFESFTKNFLGCRIEVIDLETMILTIQKLLTTTPAHSELSRLMQLIKAGGGKITYR